METQRISTETGVFGTEGIMWEQRGKTQREPRYTFKMRSTKTGSKTKGKSGNTKSRLKGESKQNRRRKAA